jgi:hypothetical protein
MDTPTSRKLSPQQLQAKRERRAAKEQKRKETIYGDLPDQLPPGMSTAQYLQAKINGEEIPPYEAPPPMMSIEEAVALMPGMDEQERWQQYVVASNFVLANHHDPEIKAKALERLAKTSTVGLYESKITVNVNTLPKEEIQRRLETLVNRINARVIEHE